MIMVTNSKVGEAGKFFALGFDMARFLASQSIRWWGTKTVLTAFSLETITL